MDKIIPDQINPVVGYKSLRIQSNYDKPMLASPQQGTTWPLKSAFQATCMHSKKERLRCNCGINAYKELDALEKSEYGHHDIYAQLAMWGEVQDCKWGYRSEYAYPTKLIVRSPLSQESMDQLSDLYAVPVEVNIPSSGKVSSAKSAVNGVPAAPLLDSLKKRISRRRLRDYEAGGSALLLIALTLVFALFAISHLASAQDPYSDQNVKTATTQLEEGEKIVTPSDTDAILAGVIIICMAALMASVIFIISFTPAPGPFTGPAVILAAVLFVFFIIVGGAAGVESDGSLEKNDKQMTKISAYKELVEMAPQGSRLELQTGVEIPRTKNGNICRWESRCVKVSKLTSMQMIHIVRELKLDDKGRQCKNTDAMRACRVKDKIMLSKLSKKPKADAKKALNELIQTTAR